MSSPLQILWTGLLSTDLALLIEVRPHSSGCAQLHVSVVFCLLPRLLICVFPSHLTSFTPPQLSALNTVSSVDASIIYTAEPVLGAGLAFLMLGERWGPSGWVGAGEFYFLNS